MIEITYDGSIMIYNARNVICRVDAVIDVSLSRSRDD